MEEDGIEGSRREQVVERKVKKKRSAEKKKRRKYKALEGEEGVEIEGEEEEREEEEPVEGDWGEHKGGRKKRRHEGKKKTGLESVRGRREKGLLAKAGEDVWLPEYDDGDVELVESLGTVVEKGKKGEEEVVGREEDWEDQEDEEEDDNDDEWEDEEEAGQEAGKREEGAPETGFKTAERNSGPATESRP